MGDLKPLNNKSEKCRTGVPINADTGLQMKNSQKSQRYLSITYIPDQFCVTRQCFPLAQPLPWNPFHIWGGRFEEPIGHLKWLNSANASLNKWGDAQERKLECNMPLTHYLAKIWQAKTGKVGIESVSIEVTHFEVKLKLHCASPR